jgi:hypothetical protein
MTSQIHLQAVWNLEANKYFEDLDKFIIEWNEKLKICRCDDPECKHYNKERWERFGKIENKIFNLSLAMNTLSFIAIQKSR